MRRGNEGTQREREKERDSDTQETLPLPSLSASFITAVSRVQVERRNLRNEWFVRARSKEGRKKKT